MGEKKHKSIGGAFHTPLRYPGGKGRLGPWLAEVLQHNNLVGGWYVEPFAGGAGAGMYLLMRGLVEHVVINDADPAIHAFWTSATKRTQELISLVRSTRVNLKCWENQRLIIETPSKFDPLEVGFAAFFLNRTNRSGILAGGVIGGKKQDGDYKLNARFNKSELIERIQAIGEKSKKITVLRMDALNLLTDVAPGFPEKSLVYLDPPYYIKGSQLYRNFYVEEDHAAIANCVSWADYPVIVTYDDCPRIRRLYRDFLSSSFSLHYSTHSSRPKTSEILFYANITLPFGPAMTKSERFPRRANVSVTKKMAGEISRSL